MKFVIPSYKRSQQFKSKTFAYLLSKGVSVNDIFVFVRNDDPELESYMDIHNELNIITTDVKGIGKTHNFISQYFDEGEYIVEIDDDMTDLLNHKRETIQDFIGVCQMMREKLIEEECSYGGTYAFDNPLFQGKCKEFTTDLKYMLGCLRFRIVRKDIKLETNYAEDFENCILHYIRDGKILKNNWIAPKTNNYSAGGCKADGRNTESEKIDKEFLANVYPQYATLFQRKSGVWDLRLRHKKVDKLVA